MFPRERSPIAAPPLFATDIMEILGPLELPKRAGVQCHPYRFGRSASAKGFGGAGDEARTRDVLLGKEVLYH